jgi:hypothetical protein
MGCYVLGFQEIGGGGRGDAASPRAPASQFRRAIHRCRASTDVRSPGKARSNSPNEHRRRAIAELDILAVLLASAATSSSATERPRRLRTTTPARLNRPPPSCAARMLDARHSMKFRRCSRHQSEAVPGISSSSPSCSAR